MAEFIYTMRKVRKAHGDKVILDDVTLNFLPGAKIGVVGPNGAGKSSVLRIMAGLDIANNGDAFIAPGSLAVIEAMRHVAMHRVEGNDHIIRKRMARVVAAAVGAGAAG